MSFLDNIKEVPITDFAERIGFTTVRKGNKYVSLKEHDSVMIDTYKNCFWRNSKYTRGSKGAAGSIIDFAMEFNGAADHKEAMRQIALMYGIQGEQEAKVSFNKVEKKKTTTLPPKEDVKLEFPAKDKDSEDVYNYLCEERGIDKAVLRYFFNKRMLYQDKHKNCVFATQLFCCVRSTGEKKFVQDKSGCDYNECFYFQGKKDNNTLIVAESVIDIMSVMTELCHKKKMFINYDYLALSGTGKLMSVKYHTDKNPTYKNVILCYDNDEAGRNAIASTKESLKDTNIKVIVCQAPSGKDWNDYIVRKKMSSR